MSSVFASLSISPTPVIGPWASFTACIAPWPRGALDREVVDAAPQDAPGPTLAAVGQLQESWREVLMMRYVEGSGLAEIGALLGIGPRAVEGRLRRARTELRRLLEAQADEETTS